MFDQMKQIKELMGMLGNPAELKEKFERMQAELAELTAEAEAGAGAVRATVNGKMQVLSIRLDPAMLGALAGEGTDDDREMVEELVASAVNSALEKARQMAAEKLGGATGGLPGGLDLGLGIPGLGS